MNSCKKLTEKQLHEAARKAIVDLVGVISTSLSVHAKKTRIIRIIEDLQEAVDGAQVMKAVIDEYTSPVERRESQEVAP